MNFYQLPHKNDGTGFWLRFLLVIVLMSILGLGWIIKSLLIFLVFLMLVPVIAAIAFQWWLSTRFVTDRCPVCHESSTALKDSTFACPSCGEPLEIVKDHFVRLTPDGTIDIEVQTIE